MIKTELEKKLAEMQKQFDKMQKQLDQLKQVKIEGIKERWKPEFDETYHSVGTDGVIYHIDWDDTISNEWRYLTGNVFKTQKEALEHKKKLEFQAKFRSYVEKHSDKLDWNDVKPNKWYMYYSYYRKEILFLKEVFDKTQGTIYASSEQILRDAIEEIGEENVKKYVLEVEE